MWLLSESKLYQRHLFIITIQFHMGAVRTRTIRSRKHHKLHQCDGHSYQVLSSPLQSMGITYSCTHSPSYCIFLHNHSPTTLSSPHFIHRLAHPYIQVSGSPVEWTPRYPDANQKKMQGQGFRTKKEFKKGLANSVFQSMSQLYWHNLAIVFLV